MDTTPPPEKRTMYEGPKLARSSTGRSIPGSRRGRPVVLLLLLGLAAGGVYYFATHPEITPQEAFGRLTERWQGLREEILRRAGKPSVDPAQRRVADGRRRRKPAEEESADGREPVEPPKPAMSVTSLPEPEIPAEKKTTLYLKNGERVSGELVRETPEAVVLRWEAGDIEFHPSEILQIIRPSPADPLDAIDTPASAAREVTLHLKNGGVVTGALVQELPDQVILKFEYGEVSFHRTEIDRIE